MKGPPLSAINAMRLDAMRRLPGWAVDFDGHAVALIASPSKGHPDAHSGIRVVGWPVEVLVRRVRHYEARVGIQIVDVVDVVTVAR